MSARRMWRQLAGALCLALASTTAPAQQSTPSPPIALFASAGQSLSPSSSPTFAGLTLTNMTQGSVMFAGSGGVLSQDNSKFFYNPTSHLLGVGIQTPFSALHVASTLASAGALARFSTGDYVDGTTGSGLLLGTGANTGDTYSTIGAFKTGFSAVGNLVVQNTGGNFSIKNTSAPALLTVGTTGATAQSFNMFTDASNYEVAYMGDWGVTANAATYGTGKAGSGSSRNWQFMQGGTRVFDYGISLASAISFPINDGSSSQIGINAYGIRIAGAGGNGMLEGAPYQFPGIALTGNLMGGNFGGSAVFYMANGKGSAFAQNGGDFIWYTAPNGTAGGFATVVEYMRLSNTGLLTFQGQTTSYPALKRNGTALEHRLGDDSAYGPMNAAAITAMAGTSIPVGGTAGAGLMVSSTANFGVFFGSGAPTLSAAKGSLYLRSDGSTTNDRAYINTNGSTTWTAFTTGS